MPAAAEWPDLRKTRRRVLPSAEVVQKVLAGGESQKNAIIAAREAAGAAAAAAMRGRAA